MTDRLPDGAVFDCDGTLADTESLSDEAWRETLATYGYELTDEDVRAVIGHPFQQNWDYFTQRAELGDRDAFRAGLRGRFLELFDRDLELHDDAVDTLRALSEAGVPVAVASSSSHEHVRRVLDRGGVLDHVSAIVGADDVPRHKPDPTPYVVAATHLDLDPRRCTAVEDTSVGVAAAVAAGMFVVGVVRAHTRPDDLAEAHRVVDQVTVGSLVPPTDRPHTGGAP
jgi:HAD superfamily hydrolase (TIGR01509 family)